MRAPLNLCAALLELSLRIGFNLPLSSYRRNFQIDYNRDSVRGERARATAVTQYPFIEIAAGATAYPPNLNTCGRDTPPPLPISAMHCMVETPSPRSPARSALPSASRARVPW
jgi:hypothetical protein